MCFRIGNDSIGKASILHVSYQVVSTQGAFLHFYREFVEQSSALCISQVLAARHRIDCFVLFFASFNVMTPKLLLLLFGDSYSVAGSDFFYPSVIVLF